MNGYGSHTYMWVNAAGEKIWVKFHFKTDQGAEILTEEEAAAIRGETPTTTIEDLYKAIDAGEHPTWTVKVQVMPYEDAASYRFNPFDLTKVWPHGDYPRDPDRQADAEPQPGQLLRADRAGGVRAQRAGAGHRVQPGQDAARPGVRLRRHAPLPDRPELPPAAGQPAEGAGEHLHLRRRRWPTTTRATPRSTPPTRRRRGFADETGQDPTGWEVDGEMVRAGLHAARRGRRLRPARHAGARGHGRRRPGPADRQHHRPRLAGRVRRRCSSGCSTYWRNVDKNVGDAVAANFGK